MISNMVQYLRKFEADGAKVIGREVSFEFQMGQAQIRGQVDRLELYPDGRVMIVDLKTGNKTFTAEEAREHAQLGLYQLAYENGAFNEQVDLPAEAKLGGAKLLLVSGDKPTEREQVSILESESDRKTFEQMVAAATSGMAMGQNIFVAQVGSHCTNENEFGSCQVHLTKAVSYVG
jgi:RecB family exonuclease